MSTVMEMIAVPPGAQMAKKKPRAKATLYVEIDADLKARIDRQAERSGRKIVAEVSRALEFYLAAHEPKPDHVEG